MNGEQTDYLVVVKPDRSTAGDEPIYVAEHPELPGCFGHGPTVDAARASLDRSRRAYLRALDSSSQPHPKARGFGALSPVAIVPASAPARWTTPFGGAPLVGTVTR